MFFKNLLIYRFTSPFQVPANLDDLLGATPFAPCGSQDMAKSGWVAPMPDGEQPSHTVNGCTLICLRTQKKILPAAALADALDEKVRKIETDEARKVYRKERRHLKEEILITLAPRALTRSTRTYAYVDTTRQWLIVDSSNRNRAEELLTQLRTDIGNLPLVPLTAKSPLAAVTTRWLANMEDPPQGFVLGMQCDLRDPVESTNTVKVRGQDLRSAEVDEHIAAGKQVSRIEIGWRDGIDCILGDDMTIRRLAFTDELLDALETQDDARAQFDQEFSVMTIETGRLVADVLEALGGVEQ